ncbi:MAG: T9SS type A sorting domain-containing protein [Candidatus Eisenbacteria bacterium]|nr:T9SS type A sorting domain-containing protein [Candidatus Eisenbacteria bacterium]
MVRPFRVTGGPGHTEVQIDVELLAYNYGGYGYSMVSWSAAVQGVAELNGTLTGGYIDSTAVFSWIHELNCGETYFLELRMDADTNGNTLLAYLTLVGPAGSPLGACCYGDCEVLAESECQERGGTYLGNGTECAPGNCPTTGACCDALTGVCVVASPQDCGLGGSRYDYLGDGSLCDPNPCATPVGACCASEGCTQTTEAECGGAFLGIGVDCGACATGVDQPAVPIDSKPRALPNPSSGATTITFSLAKPGWTSVRIYDSGGRLVRVLGVGEMTAGQHAMTWDGKSDAGAALPAGVYYSRVETGAGVVTGRVVRR